MFTHPKPTRLRGAAAAALAMACVAAPAALADNTIKSTDIVDGEVKSSDIANDAVSGFKIDPSAFNNSEFETHTPGCPLTSLCHRYFGIKDNAIDGSEIEDGSIGASDIGTNALTSAQIDESTLATPSIVVGAHNGPGELTAGLSTIKTLKGLPAGRWVVTAKLNVYSRKYDGANEVLDAACVLYTSAGVLDGGVFRGDNDFNEHGPRGGGTITMVGWQTTGAPVNVGVRCGDNSTSTNNTAQMRWSQLRITATRAGQLSAVALQ